MNPNNSTTARADVDAAIEAGRSADVDAALDTLTREAREQDGTVTREEIEGLVNEALANDPQGEFARHFLEALQAERDLAGGLAREPSPQTAIADQQEVDAAIDADPDPELEDGPDFDDGGVSYG